jgi:hypothetical protein
MKTTIRGASRTLLPFVLGAILLGAANAEAQSAPAAKSDSAATKADSAAHSQPKNRGFFARAVGAATQAAAAVQQKTGIDPKAALTGAALVAARANPAAAMMQAMQAAQQAQMAQAGGGGIASRLGSGITGMAAASAMGAAQTQAMQRMQQMMLGAVAGPGTPAAGSPELSALQLQVTQMATLAAHGDKNAMGQLMRFQGEMAGAMMRIGALAPAQQQSALPAAMRAAIACATSAQQCAATK